MHPLRPDAPFSTGNAMGRNKLIYAQSLLTLVVASDVERGGTWAGATEALRRRHGRVGVWRGPGEGPGNEVLENRGATAIRSSDRLDELLGEPEPAAPGLDGEQISLFSIQTADAASEAADGARHERDRS